MLEDKESVKLAKEGVCYCHKITRPHLFGMIFQKSMPVLVRRMRRPGLSHMFLDSPFSYLYIQLQEFSPYPLGSPQRVLGCHLLNKVNCFLGYFWLGILWRF